MIGVCLTGSNILQDTTENLFWVGLINHHDLPKHAVWFDVCLIPFEAGQIAKTTSPLKLYEYFHGFSNLYVIIVM